MTAAIWIAVSIILFLGTFATLLILSARRHARQISGRLHAALDDLVSKHALVIHHRDFLLRKIIALDSQKNILVFVDCSGEEDQIDIIDLKTMDECRVVHMGSKIHESRNGTRIVDDAPGQIGLSLFLKGQNDLYLQFYNEISDGLQERKSLSGKANKWCKILKGELLP